MGQIWVNLGQIRAVSGLLLGRALPARGPPLYWAQRRPRGGDKIVPKITKKGQQPPKSPPKSTAPSVKKPLLSLFPFFLPFCWIFFPHKPRPPPRFPQPPALGRPTRSGRKMVKFNRDFSFGLANSALKYLASTFPGCFRVFCLFVCFLFIHFTLVFAFAASRGWAAARTAPVLLKRVTDLGENKKFLRGHRPQTPPVCTDFYSLKSPNYALKPPFFFFFLNSPWSSTAQTTI